jgi:hypothetical protein
MAPRFGSLLFGIGWTSMTQKILIYEPLYKEKQELADSSFKPLTIVDNSLSGWRELKHLIDLYDSGTYLQAEFTGLFSPKFQLKTHISGAEFIHFVDSNPGGDVYFINPFPQIRYWSYNVWMQGEIAHPGLKKAAIQLLKAAQISIDIDGTPRQGREVLAYSNFWVGTPKFWEQYVGAILKPIYKFLLENPNHVATHGVMDITRHTVSAPFLPFIIERLFSTYLSFSSSLKIISYQAMEDFIVEKYCINDFERLLLSLMKQEVDVADSRMVFSDSLREKMHAFCHLFQQHHDNYYEFRPHPHS